MNNDDSRREMINQAPLDKDATKSINSSSIQLVMQDSEQVDHQVNQQAKAQAEEEVSAYQRLKQQASDLDDVQIEKIYYQSQQPGRNWTMFLMLPAFLCYCILEAFFFIDSMGMSEVLTANINMGDGLTFLSITEVTEIPQLISNRLQLLYDDVPYSTRISEDMKELKDLESYLTSQKEIENGEIDRHFISALNLTAPDKPIYGVKLVDNYFIGARLSTIQAELASSNQTIFSETNPLKRAFMQTFTRQSPSKTEPNLGPFTYRTEETIEKDPLERGGGGYGIGYSQFFPGDMSLKEAKKLLESMINNGWWNEQRHLSTCVEIMFYNEQIKMGLVRRIDLFSNNQGQVYPIGVTANFLPHAYDLSNHGLRLQIILKIVFFEVVMLLRLIQFISQFSSLYGKLRILIKKRINEFFFQDITLMLTFVIFCLAQFRWCLIFGGQISKQHMMLLPVRREKVFQHWIDQATNFRDFRILIGLCGIFDSLNLLMLLSNFFPSLGILFETVERAWKHLLTYTMIAILFFIASSMACVLIFGQQLKKFSTIGDSMENNSFMIWNEISYDQLYKANSSLARYFFLTFIFVFAFLIMPIYTAIMIQTYEQLRRQKLLLSQAMARILLNKFKTRVHNWRNFLCCVKNRQQQDKRITQVIRENWAEIKTENHETKQEIITTLKETAHQIALEQRFAMQKSEKQKTDSGFQILKANLKFGVYFVVAWFFFNSATNNTKKFDVIKPISKFLQKPYLYNPTTGAIIEDARVRPLKEIVTAGNIVNYFETITESLGNFGTFGYSVPVGHTSFRITSQLNSRTYNHNLHTAAIFPMVVVTQFNNTAFASYTYDELARDYVAKFLFSIEETKYKNPKSELQFQGKKLKKVEPQLLRESCMGLGGFVIEFGPDKLEKEFKVELSKINKAIYSNPYYKLRLQRITYELYLYNPPHNTYSYVVIEFEVRPNGRTTSNLFFYADNPTDRFKWDKLTLFSLFLLLTILYIVAWILRIVNQWRCINREESQGQPIVVRTKFASLLLWIGIDIITLRQYNILQIVFMVIYMLLCHIFNIARKLIKSTVNVCGDNVFKYIEALVVIWNIRLVARYIQLLMLSAQEDSKQLQSASEMAFYYRNFPYNCSIAIYFMGLRTLEIFRFSIIANLTISSIFSGAMQILNVLIIFFIILCGEAITGYFVFGLVVTDYSSIQASFTTMIRHINGQSAFAESIQMSLSQKFVYFFIFSSIIIKQILIMNIFLAIVKGEYTERLAMLYANRDGDEQPSDGMYTVIWKVLSKEWIQTYRTKLKEKMKEEKEHESLKDAIVQFTWGFGWPVPNEIVKLLNAMLDPANKRLEVEQSGTQEAKKASESKIEEVKVDEEDENEDEASEKPSHHESSDSNECIVDADYSTDHGLLPYQRNFEKILSFITQYKPDDSVVPIELEQQQCRFNKKVDELSSIQIKESWQQKTSKIAWHYANFWMFHLDQSLTDITRKNEKLCDLRNYDTFLSSLIVQTDSEFTKFQLYVNDLYESQSDEYEQLLNNLAALPSPKLVSIFKSRNQAEVEETHNSKDHQSENVFDTVLNFKHSAWTAIDDINHRNIRAQYLHKVRKAKRTTQEDPALKIMAALESKFKQKSVDEPLEQYHESLFQSLIANELTFASLIQTHWRLQDMNMVPQELRCLWLRLSLKEKYELWYNRFNVRERVRLWNSLVFQIGWFSKVVKRSMDVGGQQIGRPRTDLEQMIKKICKRQKAGISNYRRDHDGKITSDKKTEIRTQLYGAKELKELWECLYYDRIQPKDKKRKKSKASGVKDDFSKLEISDSDAKIDDATHDVTSGGLKEETPHEQIDAEDSIEDQNEFGQIFFFFSIINNYMQDTLERINFVDTYEIEDHQYQFVETPTRTFKQFETIVKEYLPGSHFDPDDNEETHKNTAQEERLALWMLLTKREKFDMFFHQIVEHEAQILGYLIEIEHGKLDSAFEQYSINYLDNQIDDALNQTIYRKYLAMTRHKAISQSMQYFKESEKRALDYDNNIIRYASFLKLSYQTSEKEIMKLQFKVQDKQQLLNQEKAKIKETANMPMWTVHLGTDNREAQLEKIKKAKLFTRFMK